MPTFIPPTRLIGPTTLAIPHPGNSLMRHYKPRPVGVNVWALNDGTLTETQPMDPSVIAHVYHGGHIHRITDTEATALVDAGYSVIAERTETELLLAAAELLLDARVAATGVNPFDEVFA